MPQRTYQVRVYVKAAAPAEPGKEEPRLAFPVQASAVDKASTIARARLEDNGHQVLGLSHGPERTIVATVARSPREGRPKTMVAQVVQPRAQPRRK